MQSLARCEKIILRDIQKSLLTPTLIVLPHRLGNAAEEMKVDDHVNTDITYKNFCDMARVLTGRPITASIIMPVQDARSELWEEHCDTVSAVVGICRERGFETLVVDQYNAVRLGCPYAHPAGCLATNHPKRDQPFQEWQIHTFLQNIHVTLKDVLLLLPFQLQEKPLRSRKANDVACPNKLKRPEFETVPDSHYRCFNEDQHPHGDSVSKRPKQLQPPRVPPLKEKHDMLDPLAT
ncbi:hypothetical protein Aduo_011551 [Ancylostoma duodenale]